MSESFDKAVKAASKTIAGQHWRAAMDDARAAIEAALPHLTAEDAPHLIQEAWDEGREIGYNEALGFQGPTNSHAEEDQTHD